ncbi:MAG: hypothetical protein CMD22_07040 [Flavobacteriales bacterium]|nr:hypothetical protein [Flavobacteriales bacterium]|tara:strand:+ start:718 stop:1947 length:1230 start_codon:yes stop_codon:yes gene_type:complete
MKKYILFILIYITSFNIQSQNQSISMNSGYDNQIFYSMQNGEMVNIQNDNWDIAFSTDAFSSTIRINDGKGVQLYTYHLGDTTDWNMINTSTPNILYNQMYNSDITWETGAFDINTTSSGFDYGWGVYNLQTHHIVGDSIFIIQTINGNWKKLWIESKQSGEYFFKYSNLDGTGLVNTSIQSSNYNNKRFIYYSLDQDLLHDREPDLSSWDITFTKYITPVQGMPYPVTGVLSNVGIKVAKAMNISDPFNYIDVSSHVFLDDINTIGYDWKTYQGTYIVDNNRCYFVKDYNNNIWRVIFTVFEGTSTGNIEFNTELVSTSNSVKTDIIRNFEIYPNPTSTDVNIVYEFTEMVTLQINDIHGRLIYNTNLEDHQFASITLPIYNFEDGVYIVSIMDKDNNNQHIEKLIIH